MLQHVVVSGDSAQHLMDALAQGSHQDTVHVFSDFVRLWLECTSLLVHCETSGSSDWRVNASTANMERQRPADVALPDDQDQRFYSHEKNRLFHKIYKVDDALYNVLKFTTFTAHQSVDIRWGMLDAGVLALILAAFVNGDFQPPSLIDVSGAGGDVNASTDRARRRETFDVEYTPPLPISLDVIHTEASTLSVSCVTRHSARAGETISLILDGVSVHYCECAT